ncbi:MAG: exosortase/archaeosortase family protein [Planctomycetota bacterium]|nr:exosortase/archaeosortase family protein [Planctomycetota bacterium]
MTERRTWRFSDGVLLMGLVALAIAATWSIWEDIFLGYALRDQEQSHILLAPFVALWLAWVRRGRTRYVRPRWTIAGAVVVAAGWMSAWYGLNSQHEIFWHFGALSMVVGAALTIAGMDLMRYFGPAVVALIFLLPIPGLIRQEISLPLQQITASVTQFLLEVFGQPVSRAGNVLTINGREVAVAEACNGMRMVAALVLVSYAFIFSVPMRQEVRLFILAISPLVAIVCNVIRLLPTTLLYGFAEPETADLFHDISGWVMLPIALAMLWGVFVVLRWIEVPIAPYAVVEE